MVTLSENRWENIKGKDIKKYQLISFTIVILCDQLTILLSVKFSSAMKKNLCPFAVCICVRSVLYTVIG